MALIFNAPSFERFLRVGVDSEFRVYVSASFYLRITALFGVLTGLLLVLGYIVGLYFGNPYLFTGLALVLAAVFHFISYYYSDSIVIRMSRAKIIQESDNPTLFRVVREVARKAGMPMPKVGILESAQPNAFATGRNPNHAAVAVTRGLWQRLEPQEVEGVLGHELSHIANRDVLVMTVASFFAMLAGLLTRFGLYSGMFGGGRSRDNNSVPIWLIVLLVSVVTYFLSQILILAISRYREFAADRGSALITGAPEHLMSALQKIANEMFRIPQRDLREVEGMNAFFIIPTSVKSATSQLFMTHPPLEKRLAALSEIAREMGRPVS